MTQGINLLARVIDQQTLNVFRDIQSDWMVDDEARVYTFIRDYVRQYRRLPDHSVLEQNGIALPRDLEQPIEYYRDQVSRRHLMTVARDQGFALSEAVRRYDSTQVQEAYMRLGQAISLSHSQLELMTYQDLARQGLDRAQQALYSASIGYTTGYPILDQYIGGWQRQDVNVIVGRPGTGKSYILLNMIRRAWESGHSVMLVSLEMSGIQMATRMLASQSGINPEYFRTGEIPTFTHRNLQQLITNTETQYPPFYLMTADVRRSIQDVEAAIDRVDPAIVYVDAGYLLTTNMNPRNRTRRESIAEVIEEMKGLSIRSDKAFVTTVQFNRNVKAGKRPADAASEMSLENIGETDVIGQIASNIIGIHPPKKDPISRRERILELLKNREGELIKFRTNFLFDPPNFEFIDLVNDQDPEQDSERDVQRRAQEHLNQMGWMV